MKLRFFFMVGIFFSLGLFTFLLYKKIIILEFAWPYSMHHKIASVQELQKKVLIFYPQDQQFESEETVMMWEPENPCLTLKHLSNLWFALLFDEGILTELYTVQEVLVNELETELYVSVDKTFLKKAWSINAKWRLIESWLKTIKYACPKIQAVNFLVNFEMMQDAHLDFSQPWPIDGFFGADE